MEQGGGDMRPSKVWERAAPLPDRDFAIPCYRLRPPYNVFQLRTSWVPIFLSFVSSSLSLNGRFIIISRLICWGNWTSSWCFRFNMRSNKLRSATEPGRGDHGKVQIRVLCSFYNKTFEANSLLLYCQRGSGYFWALVGLCKKLSCVALHESGQLHSAAKNYERNPNEALLLVKPSHTTGTVYLHLHVFTGRYFWGDTMRLDSGRL